MTRTGHTASVEDTMRSIERRVYEDVWLPPVGRRVGVVLAVALAVAAVVNYLHASADVGWVYVVTTTAFTVTSATSLIALHSNRFRWCCAATYLSGLTTVIGMAEFWWHRTGGLADTPWAAAIGTLITGVLTAGWLRLVLSPVERSHPDMRRSS